MSFNKLGSIIGNKRLQPALGAAMIVSMSQEILSTRAKALTFKQGVLKLNVPSSVAASQLQLMEEELIRQINARLGKDLILRIRYKVGK